MGLTVDEVLESGGVVESETEGIVTIDSDTRKMEIPDCYNLLGVESDEKVKRVFFYFPRYTGNDYDLSTGNLYVNYQNAAGNTNRYIVDDLVYNDEYVAFSWLTYRSVFEADGTIYFAVCAKLSDDDGETEQEWNTRVSTATVGEGLEATVEVEDEDYDAIAQLLTQANAAAEYIDAIDAQVEAAAASATAAAESAEAAAEYANLAEQHMNGAEGGATAAANYATAASESATAAATSASEAAESATAAAESESNAATYASAAASNAAAAAASADASADSAIESAESAEAAAESEESASTSEAASKEILALLVDILAEQGVDADELLASVNGVVIELNEDDGGLDALIYSTTEEDEED